MAVPEHEKLTVYARARQTARSLDDLAARVPDWRADLRDQLRRASASIPLNIAEGAGEFRPAEKARFYRIARRSAAECMAALDLSDKFVSSSEIARAKGDLAEIASMLTAMVKTVEARRR